MHINTKKLKINHKFLEVTECILFSFVLTYLVFPYIISFKLNLKIKNFMLVRLNMITV